MATVGVLQHEMLAHRMPAENDIYMSCAEADSAATANMVPAFSMNSAKERRSSTSSESSAGSGVAMGVCKSIREDAVEEFEDEGDIKDDDNEDDDNEDIENFGEDEDNFDADMNLAKFEKDRRLSTDSDSSVGSGIAFGVCPSIRENEVEDFDKPFIDPLPESTRSRRKSLVKMLYSEENSKSISDDTNAIRRTRSNSASSISTTVSSIAMGKCFSMVDSELDFDMGMPAMAKRKTIGATLLSGEDSAGAKHKFGRDRSDSTGSLTMGRCASIREGDVEHDAGMPPLTRRKSLIQMLYSEEDCMDLADVQPNAGKDRTDSANTVSTTASIGSTCGRRRSFPELDSPLPVGKPRRRSLPEVETPPMGQRTSGGMVSVGAPSSDVRYHEPAQTMIMLDWDDTLFPSTEVFDRWGVSYHSDGPAPPERDDVMQAWRDALLDYLTAATSLSDKCVIITNSKRTWVESCIRRFAPCLAKFFRVGVDGKAKLKVVYAVERASQSAKMRSTDLRPVRSSQRTREEYEDEQMRAKFTAMKEEVAEFYSQYTGQSWKNIYSEGDMRYEYNAVTELAFRRNSKKPEKLRTKAIMVPTEPTITELTMRLKVGRLLLPAYVRFDGDLDLDLKNATDPLGAIADALHLPHLKDVPLSLHAWGWEPEPEDLEQVEDDLADIAVIVHGYLFG